jgi:hypothetical protein
MYFVQPLIMAPARAGLGAPMNKLYFGDNIDVLRERIKDTSSR